MEHTQQIVNGYLNKLASISLAFFLGENKKMLRDFLALLWMQLSSCSCRTAPKLNAKPAVCSMKGSYFSPAALSLSLFDFAVFVDGLTRHSSSCNLSLFFSSSFFFLFRFFDSSNDGEFFRCFQLGDEKMEEVKIRRVNRTRVLAVILLWFVCQNSKLVCSPGRVQSRMIG